MSNTQQRSDLIGQREQRIEKVKQLKKLGYNPYPGKGERTHENIQISEDYKKLEGKEVKVLGRIMTWREHGEIQFLDLQDPSGRTQLYIRNDEMGKSDSKKGIIGLDNLGLLDVGDHIEATGTVTKTKTGQESVLVKGIRLMSKSLRPMPAKWGGIEDKDIRYRRRYLDMTLSPEVRESFVRKAKFWTIMREFLNKEGFVEINTPILEHTTGGADATPFTTHLNALGEDFFLRISHELPLKRLLGGGFEKVYDIGARFRNEGFSDEHLPEHNAMEWYWAYGDQKDGMDLTERMYKAIAKEVWGTLEFEKDGMKVNLADKWEVIDFADIIREKFDIDVFDDTEEKMYEVFVKNGGDKDTVKNRSRLADGLWKLIRKTIAGPKFLVGVPKFLSPLAKEMDDDPRKTYRFHPIIFGSELANAFGELNDPQEQLERFVDQQEMRAGGDDETHMMDIDFVEMLEYGMPPAVGFGLSERVFWMLEGVTAKEGVVFPPMRRHVDPLTKKIYGDILKEDADAGGQDFSKKIILVLNSKLEGWQLTNTIGHISAYLGNKIEDFGRKSFETKDGETIPANTQYGVVTKTAKPSQLLKLLNEIEDTPGVDYIAYTQDMIDLGDDIKLAKKFKKQNKEALNYLGIGIFGKVDVLDKLTKKYSLFK